MSIYRMVKECDKLGLNYLSSVDVDVCKYVINNLPNVNGKNYNKGSILSFDEVLELSIEEMGLFGIDIKNRLDDILLDVDFEKGDSFSTVVFFSRLRNGIVLVNSGMIDSYIIPGYPDKMYEWDVYSLAHEHIHALKETSYKEYRDSLVLGEVLPIFYELMISLEDENTRDVMRYRLVNLCNIKNSFRLYDLFANMNLFNNDSVGRGRFSYLRSDVGVYINSFYYAVILYSMYKEETDKILNLVCMVLRKEMTTLDLLKQLNIYGDIRGEVFEREIGHIKRLVK